MTGSILWDRVLLGRGSNPAAVRVFRNRPPKDLRQWARILLLFGCFGTGLQRTCAKATSVFPCKAICRDDVGATSDLAESGYTGQRDLFVF